LRNREWDPDDPSWPVRLYERGNPTHRVAELIVGKNHNGPIGMASVSIREHTTRFDDLSNRDRQSTRIKDQDEGAPF
jgi:replicative DNA helicase